MAKGALCAADQEYCHEKCVTDLQERLNQATSSADSQTAVSGQNELVLACRADCDEVYFDCNRPTYLLYGGCAMLLISCPALMCLTNIFDTVREATRKEAEKLRREGLEKKEREATAPKQRERYISKKNMAKASKEAAERGESDPENPQGTQELPSPGGDAEKKRRTMSGGSSELSDDTDDLESLPDAKEDSRCVRILKTVFKKCAGFAVQMVLVPVNWCKRKYERLTKSNKPLKPSEILTELECPRCNSVVTVQGLDRPNIQESLFSKQWGLNRCATYCPVCNEIISGICAF